MYVIFLFKCARIRSQHGRDSFFLFDPITKRTRNKTSIKVLKNTSLCSLTLKKKEKKRWSLILEKQTEKNEIVSIYSTLARSQATCY